MRLTCHDSAGDELRRRTGLRCAVLKLDTEERARSAARRFSNCRPARSGDSFLFGKGGDASPWMTDQVVDLATGSRRAMYACCARSFGAANRKHQEVRVMKKI